MSASFSFSSLSPAAQAQAPPREGDLSRAVCYQCLLQRVSFLHLLARFLSLSQQATGVEHMGRNRLDLEDATTELNRLLPHNLHVELLCYWLQENFGQEQNTDRNPETQKSILTTLSFTKLLHDVDCNASDSSTSCQDSGPIHWQRAFFGQRVAKDSSSTDPAS